MAINKVTRGWQADVQPEGRGGKRIRRTFRTKREAEQFETDQKAQANTGDWKPPTPEKRRLSDLVSDWYELYGYTLAEGKARKVKLDSLCRQIGNPLAKNFTAEDFLRYRKERLDTKHPTRDKKISPNTVNHEHAYLAAVFGTLIKLRNWRADNPMKGIPKLKLNEPELIYLTLKQIQTLLTELDHSRNPDASLVVQLCLATGARWGEAESLRSEQVKDGRVHYVKTKNYKARAVPISDSLRDKLLNGRPVQGRLFPKSCYYAFKKAIERANINLPDGQLTHVLRHSFASHFMINDGNILKLKDILGHKTLAMTLRYAKLAPKHLSQAVTKNPLAILECQQSVNANVEKPAQPDKNCSETCIPW